MRIATILVLAVFWSAGELRAQPLEAGDTQTAAGNKPERVAWFQDLGLGLFIHWSVDSQLGSVISHSLVGASDDYCRRYFADLPKSFNPRNYHPDDWAELAHLAGFKYVVFTTKHHNGFCMFETKTTDFGIMHTPYGRDVTRTLIEAFRKRGIAIGLYFSPDDFWILHRQGVIIDRTRPGVTPQENPELMKHDQAQLRELLTSYGPIDLIFIDGPAEGLRELCWELQPNIVVTRGAMQTPEQHVPGVPLEGPWEACMTMGTQWQYKPTNEAYKSGTELIERFIETRAKGGNYLLNIGPKPDGVIPIEQESRLREMALWNFINGEAVFGVEGWIVTNEDRIWFTKKTGEDTVYAIITQPDWPWGERREYTLQSVRMGEQGKVDILGQSGLALEYQPTFDARTRWRQDDAGLHVSAVRAQRIYNDRKWPNAIVMRITDAHPAVAPPRIETLGTKPTTDGLFLSGKLHALGDADEVTVGFQLRPHHDSTQPLAQAPPWTDTPRAAQQAPGGYTAHVEQLAPGTYDYRAVVHHPRITLYGDIRQFTVK